MGFWCCLSAFPTHLCCWLTKMGPFLWPFLMALLPWVPLMSVGAVVALLVAVRMATKDPHPVVRVLPGEESFVAFGAESKGKALFFLVALLMSHESNSI